MKQQQKQNEDLIKEKLSVKDLKNYEFDLHQSNFTDYQFINESQLVDIKENYIAIYGNQIPEEKAKRKILYFYYIKNVSQILQTYDEYNLIYFGQEASSKGILALKRIFKQLPVQYFSKLQQFIVLRPDLLTKSIIYFKFGSRLTKKLQYLNSFEELKQNSNIPKELIEQVPDFVIEFENKMKDGQIKQEKQQELNQEKQINSQKQNENLSENQNEGKILGLNLEEMELNEEGNPKILSMLYQYFYDDEKNIQIQGIFRKASSILDDREFEKEIRFKNYQVIQENDNPLLAANLIKQIFHTMPVPLFPFSQYDKLKKIQDTSQENLIQNLKHVVQSLSVQERKVAQQLFQFLRIIASFEEKTDMTEYNLAVCIMPCILKPQKYDLSDLSKQQLMVQLVLQLIKNQDILFNNNQEDLELNRVSNFSDDDEEYDEEQGQEGEEKYNENEENCKQLENSQLSNQFKITVGETCQENKFNYKENTYNYNDVPIQQQKSNVAQEGQVDESEKQQKNDFLKAFSQPVNNFRNSFDPSRISQQQDFSGLPSFLQFNQNSEKNHDDEKNDDNINLVKQDENQKQNQNQNIVNQQQQNVNQDNNFLNIINNSGGQNIRQRSANISDLQQYSKDCNNSNYNQQKQLGNQLKVPGLQVLNQGYRNSFRNSQNLSDKDHKQLSDFFGNQ